MWLPIDDIYDVSVDGQIRKYGRCVMKGSKDTLGYHQCYFYGRARMLHRMVASRFLPAPTSENCEIDHIDRNKSNNHASNLRWCSKSCNMLNRAHKVSSKTNEPHITLYTIPSSGNIRYIVRFYKDKKTVFQKHFKTLPEAIIARNNYIPQ